MKKITFLVAALCTTMFASAAITLPLTENFAVCTKGSAATSSSTMPEMLSTNADYTAWLATGNFTLTKVYDAGGMIKFGSSSATGKFVTAPITATLDSVIVEFDAIGWTGTGDAATKKVTYGTTTVEITTTAGVFPITAEQFGHFRVAFAKVADATLTIEGGAAKSRFFLDNLSITETATATPPVGLGEVTSKLSVYANNGTIYGAENGRIYTILGMDVTEQNGNLNGIYVVKANGKTQKIAVK